MTKREKGVSVKTNTTLGLFVNNIQFLFRVMGAPPCHNNSIQEEEFNVNSIFFFSLLKKNPLPMHRNNVSLTLKGRRQQKKIYIKQ